MPLLVVSPRMASGETWILPRVDTPFLSARLRVTSAEKEIGLGSAMSVAGVAMNRLTVRKMCIVRFMPWITLRVV